MGLDMNSWIVHAAYNENLMPFAISFFPSTLGWGLRQATRFGYGDCRDQIARGYKVA